MTQMKKTTRHQKHLKQHHGHERGSIRKRSPGGIKMSPPPAAAAAADTTAKESNLPLSQFARTQDATSVGEQAILPATEAAPGHFTQCDLGTRAAVDDKPASANTAAPTHAEEKVNGQLLAIDSLQSLALEEREIVRQSDVAFIRVRQTWESWKQVRAGLVVLRDLAMREAGANDPKSKLYKDRFHELLDQRTYCSTQMHPSIRKALLKCAELAPEIDEWHDRLDERRRLQLNHPINVLHAFRESQEPPSPPDQSAQTKHEREIEKVRQEAAASVSCRDERINELQQKVEALSKHVDVPDVAESDTNTIVERVIAMCGGAEIKVKQVIEALTAYLKHRPS